MHKPKYYQVNGFISYITGEDGSRPFYYLACSVCKKKVSDEGGVYRCEGCQKSYEEVNPTYNFSFKFSDISDNSFINCLGESGEAIMGVPCKQLYQADSNVIREQFHSRYFKEMSILVRATYNQYSSGEGSSLKYALSKVLSTSTQEVNQSLL
jgi:hypothetical protein